MKMTNLAIAIGVLLKKYTVNGHVQWEEVGNEYAELLNKAGVLEKYSGMTIHCDEEPSIKIKRLVDAWKALELFSTLLPHITNDIPRKLIEHAIVCLAPQFNSMGIATTTGGEGESIYGYIRKISPVVMARTQIKPMRAPRSVAAILGRAE
jgi:hypothetical protein